MWCNLLASTKADCPTCLALNIKLLMQHFLKSYLGLGDVLEKVHRLDLFLSIMISMEIINQTKTTGFILLGLEGSYTQLVFLFVLFLLLYIATLCANFVTIALVLGSRRLHTPMYFFLSQLSSSDILLSTNIVPNLLCALLKEGKDMSVPSCISQFFACSSFTAAECFILAVMSLDRYVAICNPLRYVSIMSIKLSVHLVLWSWLLSFLLCVIVAVFVSLLEFCGLNAIDYIYCDFAPLLEVSCSDTSTVEIIAIAFTFPIIIFPFLVIILTYTSISFSIMKISTNSGRQKSFSTCSSHLAVVCTFYSILIAKYTVPSKGQSLNISKVISLLYIVVTPLLNPIIYSLRNNEIRKALIKWIS
ncbi:hypothetical protein XENTR_v10010340 [Xenopus tropicalis]|nr:hypothetical protein XENTR_v10010340 [Xenopus tropicalis]|eukprot:XP_017948216.1 PREDICTED: olfactory receptor 510-like [Xenopus tropicalis]